MSEVLDPPIPIAGQQDLNGHEAPEAPPLDEIRVGGSTQLGLFDAGGKRPTSASVRLAGGKIGLTEGTAFKKGETVVFEVVAVVTRVGLQDKRDSETGQVVSCEQQHVAHITDVRIVTDEA